MKMIQNHDPITGQKGQFITVARASVAIYLALCSEHLPADSEIIVPANLCYAGIFPAVYADLKPVFCDVDAVTGNVTQKSFAAAYTPKVRAAIVPHMYGNPVQQLPEIAAFCKKNGIVLIEDCASAMGAAATHYSLGCIGDYTVYSTGYSKTLDLGIGGFLFSKSRSLTDAIALEQSLPDLCEENERNMAFFSRLYRLMRNEGSHTRIEKMICHGLADSCKTDFLHKISLVKKKQLLEQLKNLPATIIARKKALLRYENNAEKANFLRYPYEEGATPWRFNLLIENPDLRRRIIDTCLSKGLPVSDWYPKVTPLFDETGEFPGAQLHEEQILNFPLLIEEDRIDAICELLITLTSSKESS